MSVAQGPDEIDWEQLSVRCFNALRKAGITTRAHLMSLSRSELLNIEFLGKKSVDEIETYVSSLRDSAWSPPKAETKNSAERIVSTFTDLQKGLLSKPMTVLPIPIRARTGLAMLDAAFVGDVVQLRPQVLLEVDNLGR